MATQTLARRLAHFESLHDVGTFIAMAVWIALLPLLLRCLSLPRLLSLLTPTVPLKPAVPMAPLKLQRYVGRLLRTRVGAYHPNCLKRTLVLYRFLRKAGHEVTFCLGVRKADATETGSSAFSVSGHAWLTRADQPFLEHNPGGIDGFAVTFRYPETAGSVVQRHA